MIELRDDVVVVLSSDPQCGKRSDMFVQNEITKKVAPEPSCNRNEEMKFLK